MNGFTFLIFTISCFSLISIFDIDIYYALSFSIVLIYKHFNVNEIPHFQKSKSLALTHPTAKRGFLRPRTILPRKSTPIFSPFITLLLSYVAWCYALAYTHTDLMSARYGRNSFDYYIFFDFIFWILIISHFALYLCYWLHYILISLTFFDVCGQDFAPMDISDIFDELPSD
jgi:hypothetical protein